MVLAWRRGDVRPITTGIACEGKGGLLATLGTCGEKNRVILGDDGLWDSFP